MDQFTQQYLTGGNILTFPPAKKKLRLFIFHQTGRTHADISPLGQLIRRLCGSEMLPEHVLHVFIIPHRPYLVKNPESAPPPGAGWIFLQAGQCQAVRASGEIQFPLLKKILNPGQNMHVEGPEPHQRQCLARGEGVG